MPYAISGKQDEAQRSLNELVELSKRQYVSPTQIAIVYAGLGDKDRTFTWLEQAFERRDPVLSSIKFERRLDSLRADRHYLDLLRRMRLGSARERLKLLQNMNLATDDGVLNLAGVLLFAKRPEWIKPQFIVKAIRYPGNQIHANQYLDTEDFPATCARSSTTRWRL
ncbi:MAG: hypothetical protein ACREEM_54350 [Blastocatellia bacterium]